VRSPGLVVIGGSAGSLSVILNILAKLDPKINFPIVIVLHRKSSVDTSLADLLSQKTSIPVKDIEEKDSILPGSIYIAPANYHLLIEEEDIFSLDYSEKVNFSRPSIDVTFESAAEVYKNRLVGILLSGANADGTQGLYAVNQMGGISAVQDPKTAEVPFMPQSALSKLHIDYILDKDGIASFLNDMI
jgi:two-component system, chemotaxis family, protein-glutamate methylesterase/glutaminase